MGLRRLLERKTGEVEERDVKEGVGRDIDDNIDLDI